MLCSYRSERPYLLNSVADCACAWNEVQPETKTFIHAIALVVSKARLRANFIVDKFCNDERDSQSTNVTP